MIYTLNFSCNFFIFYMLQRVYIIHFYDVLRRAFTGVSGEKLKNGEFYVFFIPKTEKKSHFKS